MNAKFLLIVTAMTAMLVAATAEPSIAQPAPPYTDLVGATATSNNGRVLFASIEAADTVPRFPDQFIESVLVFGYAWVDLDTGEGIVAAIHPIVRDSNQNPDALHTHPVTLSPTAAEGVFCLDELGTSEGGITLEGNFMNLRMPNTFTGGISPDTAASFTVAQDDDCDALGLSVTVIDAEPLA